jgi:hypothetical protein
VLSNSQTAYVIHLMEHIVPSESWGLGSAGFSAPIAFKGGWGPESDAYLVRQSGIVAPDSSDGFAVSIVVHPPAGANSFEIGTEMITATARWLRRNLSTSARRPDTRPGSMQSHRCQRSKRSNP